MRNLLRDSKKTRIVVELHTDGMDDPRDYDRIADLLIWRFPEMVRSFVNLHAIDVVVEKPGKPRTRRKKSAGTR